MKIILAILGATSGSAVAGITSPEATALASTILSAVVLTAAEVVKFRRARKNRR